MIKGLSAVTLLSFSLINNVHSAVITELNIESFEVEILSEVPVGMNIEFNDFSYNTDPIPVDGTTYFEGLGDFNVSVSGQVQEPTVFEFLTSFNFGPDVGEVSFVDSIWFGTPTTSFADGGWYYYNSRQFPMSFGTTGSAVIGQPGAYDNNFQFASEGATTDVWYALELGSTDVADVPLPASVWLFLSGLITLFARKRKAMLF